MTTMRNSAFHSKFFRPARILFGLMVMVFFMSQAHSGFPNTAMAMHHHSHHATMTDAASDKIVAAHAIGVPHKAAAIGDLCTFICDNVCSSQGVSVARYASLIVFIADKFHSGHSSAAFLLLLPVQERPPRYV